MTATESPQSTRRTGDEEPTPILDDLEMGVALEAVAGTDGTRAPSPDEVPWRKLPLREKVNLGRITGNAPARPLAVLFGLNAVDELDRSAFAVLSPEIKDAFGLDLKGLLVLTTFVLVVNLLLELPIGYIADRRNRVRIACAGAFLWGLCTVLTGLAIVTTGLGLLYVARLGSAIAKNLNTTHRSLLSDYYPIESRARVFYAHSFANNLGQILGPLAAGVLGAVAGTSAPFFILSVPTFVLVTFAATRLREPKRGRYERLAAGADEEMAGIEEEAAGFRETFRVLFKMRSARRIYLALPFITVAFLGLAQILNLFYDEVYDIGPFQRGLITVVAEGMQLAGVAFGLGYVQKVMTKNPGRVMQLLAVVAVFYSLTVVGIAASVNVGMAIFFQALGAGATAVLMPGMLACISLVVPPRMRSLGFATGSVWILLGAVFLPLIGGIGDRFGLRIGLLVFLPVYVIGSLLLASAGRPINDDIKQIRESALAQAQAQALRPRSDSAGPDAPVLVEALDPPEVVAAELGAASSPAPSHGPGDDGGPLATAPTGSKAGAAKKATGVAKKANGAAGPRRGTKP